MAPCYGWRSPHTRGARVQHQPVKAQPRIIPAYAGSTDRPLGRPRPGADHPRIRGEHHAKAFEAWNVQGSSPHTRGAPPQRHHRRPESRIIPAYAGSTCPEDAYECFLEGSSPHTRGAPTDSRSPSGAGRIIPAYAGSTPACPSPSGAGRDHPRIRGEHSAPSTSHRAVNGSSPHTRGARVHVFDDGVCRGIIPAYAGSTVLECRPPATDSDHPRIRGEHVGGQVVLLAVVGSSPHTRGAPRYLHLRRQTRRIIPAYAGSTGRLQSRSAFPEDHPRIRGEHRQELPESRFRDGSSPHTRGARPGRLPRPHESRIIPAYAGSTACPAARLRGVGDHPRIRGEHARLRACTRQ